MNLEKFVTRWSKENAPDRQSIDHLLSAENLRAYDWSNSPGDRYTAHSHAFDKVIYVVAGEITFTFPDSDEELTLKAGDRLDLPRGVIHGAVVGQEGVRCLEAHR